jgi:hypothetical protein
MMGIRLAGALLISLHLTQLAAPLWCVPPAERQAPCHETSPPGVPQLLPPASTSHMPCAQTAMCTAPAVALPEAAIVPTSPVVRKVATVEAYALRLGEQPPPLSPPPQA